MVPRGARRSDQKAHPSRLEQVRRFLPSGPCEFDSRHPLHVKVLVKGPFAVPPCFCVTARCGRAITRARVAAPPTGPSSPSFSVCVDALGDDGFA
jgi:hypothetical protein